MKIKLPTWELNSVEDLIDRCRKIPTKLGIQEVIVFSEDLRFVKIISRGKLTAKGMAEMVWTYLEPKYLYMELLELKKGDYLHLIAGENEALLQPNDLSVLNLTGLDEEGIQQVRVGIALAKYSDQEQP